MTKITTTKTEGPADFFSSPLDVRAEIPEGTHPARLIKYSDFFELKAAEQFRRPGDPETTTCFNAIFAVRCPTGECDAVELLLHKPQSRTLSAKSNVFKFISALATDDECNRGKLSPQFRMNALLGRPCVVIVEKNKKDFPTVKGVGKPMTKQLSPDDNECKELLTRPEPDNNLPF